MEPLRKKMFTVDGRKYSLITVKVLPRICIFKDHLYICTYLFILFLGCFKIFIYLFHNFLWNSWKCCGQHCLNKICILMVIWTVSSEGSNLSSSLPISSMTNINLEIWGSHSISSENSSLLGCDTVSLCGWFMTFQKIHLQVSSCAKRFLGQLDMSWHHQIPEDLNPWY